MRWQYNDGGRAAAGHKGEASDCVTRAIAIGTGLPYQQVFDLVNAACAKERMTKKRIRRGRLNANRGVRKPTYKRLLVSLGWMWTPTMFVGSGCTVHLRDGELPMGRLIVSVSKHLVAVIDGVIHDNHRPDRAGTRCVYGYWTKGGAA